jgi:hypothetical protein
MCLGCCYAGDEGAAKPAKDDAKPKKLRKARAKKSVATGIPREPDITQVVKGNLAHIRTEEDRVDRKKPSGPPVKVDKEIGMHQL